MSDSILVFFIVFLIFVLFVICSFLFLKNTCLAYAILCSMSMVFSPSFMTLLLKYIKLFTFSNFILSMASVYFLFNTNYYLCLRLINTHILFLYKCIIYFLKHSFLFCFTICYYSNITCEP